MPKGKRTRYFVHRDGFQDSTAYVRYEGTNSYLVVVERVERELRSDVQRVAAGHWRELTASQAAAILQKKRGGYALLQTPEQPVVSREALEWVLNRAEEIVAYEHGKVAAYSFTQAWTELPDNLRARSALQSS